MGSEFTAIPKEMDPEAELDRLLTEAESERDAFRAQRSARRAAKGSGDVAGPPPSGNLRDGTYQPDTEGAEGDPQPSVDMDHLAGKRTSLDTLFAQVMQGGLARGRELKSWEPDRLDERHLNVIMLRASGMDQGKIAQVTGFTDAWVSVILNHPDAQTVLAKIVGYAADNVLNLNHRIQATAGEAFDKVVNVMRTSPDEALASRNAFEILRMAGYGPVERKAVTHQFGLSDEGARELAQAMREAASIKSLDYAEFTVVQGPGSVVGGSPATSAVTGQTSGGAPPTGGSQVPALSPGRSAA
jgi:hypothetical protein